MPKNFYKFFLCLFIFSIFLNPFLTEAKTPVVAVSSGATKKEPIRRILIVPGHDDESYGTSFRGVKEADMNLKLGLYLYDLLKKDKRFKVFITRDKNGYTKEFADYFENNKDEINNFIKNSHNSFQDKLKNGEVNKINNVYHNNAPDGVVQKLYGINLWAGKNQMDAVIHIHFNDNPRPDASRRGEYKGFVIYVPEDQFKNSKDSSSLGFFTLNEMHKYYLTSNYERELGGIVPDQDLIATGSNDSLSTRSILIEYGYIYDLKFSTFKKRENHMKLMAKLTYNSVSKYFDYLKKKK